MRSLVAFATASLMIAASLPAIAENGPSFSCAKAKTPDDSGCISLDGQAATCLSLTSSPTRQPTHQDVAHVNAPACSPDHQHFSGFVLRAPVGQRCRTASSFFGSGHHHEQRSRAGWLDTGWPGPGGCRSGGPEQAKVTAERFRSPCPLGQTGQCTTSGGGA